MRIMVMSVNHRQSILGNIDGVFERCQYSNNHITNNIRISMHMEEIRLDTLPELMSLIINGRIDTGINGFKHCIYPRS